jgi:predicted nucleotidyltransferase
MPFPDFEEFIAALNEHGVKYLIVGAHAVAYHARPRATKDLDIFIQSSPANAEKLLAAMRDFLGVDAGYTDRADVRVLKKVQQRQKRSSNIR